MLTLPSIAHTGRGFHTAIAARRKLAVSKRGPRNAYDLRNLQTAARFDSFNGEGVTNAYDGFGRLTSTTIAMAGTTRTLTHLQYDADGNRRELTWPDSVKMSFGYDGLNRMDHVYEGALGSTVALATIAYSNQGQRSSMSRRYSDATTYTYDRVSRLASLTEAFVGSAGGTASNFTYLPSNQMRTIERSNDAYAWTGHVNVNRGYTANGLNQYSAAADVGFLYDLNGNLIQSGATAQTVATNYVYDVENRLVSASGAVTASLVYDPLGRLFQVSGGSGGPTQFLYDGDELVAEYDGVTGAVVNRYVHGAGVDDPLVWYLGLGLTQPRFLHTDHQGSITGIAGANGALLAIDAYDEYGIPAATNLGRFQYTGQAWIPELGMYYYKARIYSPTLGRFMQADPIGYQDQVNLYAYVRDDPINKNDPTGMHDPEVHDRVFWNAFGWEAVFLYPIFDSVSIAQDIGSNGKINYMHYLRNPGQSVKEAIDLWGKYITDQVNLANYFDSKGLFGLALAARIRAAHSYQDAFSKAHRDADGNPAVYDPNWTRDEAIANGHSPTRFQGNETPSDLSHAEQKQMVEGTVDIVKRHRVPNLSAPQTGTHIYGGTRR